MKYYYNGNILKITKDRKNIKCEMHIKKCINNQRLFFLDRLIWII